MTINEFFEGLGVLTTASAGTLLLFLIFRYIRNSFRSYIQDQIKLELMDVRKTSRDNYWKITDKLNNSQYINEIRFESIERELEIIKTLNKSKKKKEE